MRPEWIMRCVRAWQKVIALPRADSRHPDIQMVMDDWFAAVEAAVRIESRILTEAKKRDLD